MRRTMIAFLTAVMMLTGCGSKSTAASPAETKPAATAATEKEPESTPEPTAEVSAEPAATPTAEPTAALTAGPAVTEADPEKGTADTDSLITAVKEAVSGAVGEGEEITDVALDGDNLTVFVDLSNADTSKFSAADIALNRLSSITDGILALDDSFTNTWNTVTIDFGDVGSAVLTKDMIKNDGFGKYFDFTDDILK